ncbi:hypothetical protein Q3G72_010924 [Acer saccharum]|nr:hypothetical protein Q3G72_010924 [Acer saccharum]
MSSDHTISDLDISWSPNDDDGGVDKQGAVYTIASAVEQPEYVDVDDPSTSGRPLVILKDSPASLITEDMLLGIRTMYGIPSDVELRAPKEYERADWDIPGWTCLYEYTFRLGFRFPIPQLVRRMLVYYELAPEVRGPGKAPACDVAAERTRILLEIPAAQRSVSNLLTEGNFRPSRLWRWSTLNRSRAPYPHVKDFLSYIWIRRSFEILQYNLHFLKPLTDVERRFAVTTMASAEINIPDNAETLRRYKEEFTRKRAAAQKKRQAAEKSAGGSPSVVEPLLESSPERSPLKKKPRRAPAVERQKKAASSSKDKSTGSDFEPDSPMKLLASGLSSFKDPAGFLKRSDDFTLVDDDMHLKRVKTEEVFDTLLLSNFQAYQATLHLHGRYKAINDKSVALRSTGGGAEKREGSTPGRGGEAQRSSWPTGQDLRGSEGEGSVDSGRSRL